MAYFDDIQALSPTNLWQFDGDYIDTIGGSGTLVGRQDGTNQGFNTSTPICEGVTNSVECGSTSARVVIPDAAENPFVSFYKNITGWIELDSIQLPPKSIYREGAENFQYNITLWAGNKLMFETFVSEDSTVNQAFSDIVLKPNRIYHISTDWRLGQFSLYIDGVKQLVTSPSSGIASSIDLGGPRTPINFGDPSGATQVGAQPVLLNGSTSCKYNFWASFQSTDNQVIAESDIRDVLFEKGVLPSVVVNNQADLDALANTIRPDEPLNIRVLDNGGDLTLQANNITHDPLASIHIQWMGLGTLTYVNNNGSNASIISTPNNGTINVINPATLNVSPLVAGSEVRVYESGTTNEIAGIESSSSSFSASIQSSSVDVVVLSIGFLNIKVKNIDMTQGDVELPINQRVDRQYLNQ